MITAAAEQDLAAIRVQQAAHQAGQRGLVGPARRQERGAGVLLHGMPGGGKTACALELAYTHEHAFDRLVWYKAPTRAWPSTGR
jgi:DNA helicase TIP49 (TBP-interacting protein)